MALLGFLSGKSRSLTDGTFWSQFFGASNHSNEVVNSQTVMQIGAVYACMRLIAESIACLPFGMVKMNANGGSEPARDHPLHELLSLSPNADQIAVDFWESVVVHVGLRGGAFRLKQRGTGGEVVGLGYLPPPPETYWRREKNNRRTCVVTRGPHQGEHDEDDIFYVRGFGEDPDFGVSVVQAGANDFGRILSMGKHASKMLANGVRPNLIMTTPEILKPEQREQVKENIIKPYIGSENAGGVMLLEAGFDTKQVTLSPADAQMLEQMVFGVEEVCRWFRTPPMMIGHTQKSTSFGTGLEQQLIGFAKFTLLPYTKRITQAAAKQLQTASDRQTYRPRCSLDGLMEGDSKARSEFLRNMVTSGIYTPNEARAKENLPAKDGGDDLRMQVQMQPLSETIGDTQS